MPTLIGTVDGTDIDHAAMPVKNPTINGETNVLRPLTASVLAFYAASNPIPKSASGVSAPKVRQWLDVRAPCSPLRRCKVRQQDQWKIILLQTLIVAVLFPGSQELWRIRGRERRNPASRPFGQSGALRKEARKYWGFSKLRNRGEKFAEGLNGGGKGAGSELSRRGKAKTLVRLRKLTIRSVYAGLRSNPPG